MDNNNLKIGVVLAGEGTPSIPARAVCNSAGYDLYVPKDFRIEHGRNVVNIGVKIDSFGFVIPITLDIGITHAALVVGYVFHMQVRCLEYRRA